MTFDNDKKQKLINVERIASAITIAFCVVDVSSILQLTTVFAFHFYFFLLIVSQNNTTKPKQNTTTTDSSIWNLSKQDNSEQVKVNKNNMSECAVRAWFKWCLKREAICDFLLFIYGLINVPSNSDEYYYRVTDLINQLKEKKDEQDSSTIIDIEERKEMGSSEIILVILTEIDKLNATVPKMLKDGTLDKFEVFSPFRIDLKINTLVFCVGLLNKMVLSLLKLGSNDGTKTKFATSIQDFKIPQAFLQDKGSEAKLLETAFHFIKMIICLLRVFVIHGSILKDMIFELQDTSYLPKQLQLIDENNNIRSKLRYFEALLSHSNVFDIAKNISDNEKKNGGRDERIGSTSDEFAQSIDVGKDLGKQARGLCFDLLVASPQGKLEMCEFILSQCVENCQSKKIIHKPNGAAFESLCKYLNSQCRFDQFWDQHEKYFKNEEWIDRLYTLNKNLNILLLSGANNELSKWLPWIGEFETEITKNMVIKRLTKSISLSIENLLIQLAQTLINRIENEENVDARILQTLEWCIDVSFDTCSQGFDLKLKNRSRANKNGAPVGLEDKIKDCVTIWHDSSSLISLFKVLIQIGVLLSQRKKILTKELSGDELNENKSNPHSSRDYVLEWNCQKLNSCSKHALLRLLSKMSDNLGQTMNHLAVLVIEAKIIGKEYKSQNKGKTEIKEEAQEAKMEQFDQLTQVEQSILQSLSQLLSIPRDVALSLLEKTSWNMERAVTLYYKDEDVVCCFFFRFFFVVLFCDFFSFS